jgi:hypothetical protein
MNQTTRICMLTTCVGLLTAAQAFALGPFSWPGQADLPPIGRSFGIGSMLAEDTDGGVYLTNGTCQVAVGGEWLLYDFQSLGAGLTDSWGPAPQGDGIVGWLTTPGADQGKEHVQIVHLRCADMKGGPASGAWQELAAFDRTAGKPPPKNQQLLVAKDGSICHVMPDGAGIECATFPNGVLKLDARLDVSDLDARLGVQPDVPNDKLPKDDKFVGKVPEAWHVRYGTFAPDGRLFVVAERQSWIYGIDGVAYAHPDWLLELPPGPAPAVIPGKPQPIKALKGMLGVAAEARIVWEPTLGMIALLSSGDYSHEQRAVKGGDGNGNAVTVDFGQAGAGLLLIRPEDGATGYVSLTDAIARRRLCGTATVDAITCESAWGPPHLWQRPDGQIGIALPYTDLPQINVVVRDMRLHGVQFDPETLDLDADGLSRKDEAKSGTSDWSEDTDGGGTVDGAELAMAKSNPLLMGDDPWQQYALPGRFAVARSGLLMGLHDFATIITKKNSYAETWSVQGPLCAGGVCVDVDGQIITHYSDPAVKSVDGSYLLVTGPEGSWERLFFADGRRETAVSQAELTQLLPPTPGVQAGPLRALPVDANTLFMAREYGGAKMAVFERGKPGRVVFDLQQSRCDSGLGPCDKHPGGAAKTILPVHDIPRDQMSLIGYVPTTGRVVLGVAGSWDLYLLGVHATEPFAVLRHGPSLGDLLHWILPMGVCSPGSRNCDLMSDAGLMDPYLTTRDTWFGPEIADNPITPHFSGAWGDTALRIADGMEMVRYEPGVEPGDALIASPVIAPLGSEGVMLYVSKPRGGRVPLWGAAEHGLKGVDGMDVTADGTLCLADRQGKRVWEYVAQFDRVPALLRMNPEVGEILDCKYDAKGDLHLLFNDPPRIEIRQGQSVDTVPGPALAIGKHPQELVKKSDGTLEVLYVEDNLRGRLYTAAGNKVEMAQGTADLSIDGVNKGSFALWWQNKTVTFPPTWGGRITMAERADGLLLIGGTHAAPDPIYVVGSRFFAFDPRTGHSPRPWEDEHYGNWALSVAVVPGGAAVDPWTHRPVTSTVAEDGSPTLPAAPVPPTGGEKQAVAAPAHSGCQATTQAVAGWPALLAGIVLLRVRRTRAPARK